LAGDDRQIRARLLLLGEDGVDQGGGSEAQLLELGVDGRLEVAGSRFCRSQAGGGLLEGAQDLDDSDADPPVEIGRGDLPLSQQRLVLGIAAFLAVVAQTLVVRQGKGAVRSRPAIDRVAEALFTDR
jgi:hypothetical protein